ncbi:MAG: hypothetical protein Q8R98_11760, partial [Rubrivivax sp.]|nr:hypothetical protein [Rubrivivax sp.]
MSTCKPHPIALAAALALMPFAQCLAQGAPATEAAVVAQADAARPAAVAAPATPGATTLPAADARGEGLNLERVVVTGSTVLRSKFKQSVSVSNIDSEQMARSVAASATEV